MLAFIAFFPSVLLFASASFGLSPSPAQVAGGGWEAFAPISAPIADPSFGSTIFSLPDLDQDGFAEFLVGAPKASPGGISAAGSVFLYHGGDGILLHQWNGLQPQGRFGAALCAIEDLNQDGIAEFLIGAPGEDRSSLQEAGAVYCMSGADYSRLHVYRGNFSGDHVGSSLAATGDVDLDGVGDFLVGGPGRSPTGLPSAGEVRLISGSTWHTLMYFRGDYPNGGLGGSVLGVADQNTDGIPDLLMAAPFATPNSLPSSGRVRLHSGSDGQLLAQWSGNSISARFGSAMTAADLNGDGILDFALASPGAVGAAQTSVAGKDGVGAVQLITGGNLQPLWEVAGSQEYGFFGQSLSTSRGHGLSGWRSSYPSLDLDGIPGGEVFVGAPGEGSGTAQGCGRIYLLDGQTGWRTAVLDGGANSASFGTQIAAIGDTNNDQHGDVLVTAPRASGSNLQVQFFSRKLYLEVSPPSISAGGVGALNINLQFPISESLVAVRLLASAAGPGITNWQGVEIPLLQDRLTILSLQGYSAWLPQSMTLDQAASKQMSVIVPANALHHWVGRQIRFAAVSHQGLGRPRLSSAVAAVNVLP